MIVKLNMQEGRMEQKLGVITVEEFLEKILVN